MSVNLIWANLVAYSLQIGAAGGAGGVRSGGAAAAPAGRPAGLLARFAGGLPVASVGAAVEAGGGRHGAGFHLCGGRFAGAACATGEARHQPARSPYCCWRRARWLAWAGWRRDFWKAAAIPAPFPCRSEPASSWSVEGRPAHFRRRGQPGDIWRAKDP